MLIAEIGFSRVRPILNFGAPNSFGQSNRKRKKKSVAQLASCIESRLERKGCPWDGARKVGESKGKRRGTDAGKLSGDHEGHQSDAQSRIGHSKRIDKVEKGGVPASQG